MVVLSLRWGSQAYTLVLAGDDFGFGHGDMRDVRNTLVGMLNGE